MFGNENNNKCERFLTYILKYKIYGLYIRIYMEACISILLNWIIELKQRDFSSAGQIISIIISFIYIVVSIALITLWLLDWYKIFYRNKMPTYWEEMFKSIKITKFAALYSCYFLIRRLFWALFVTIFTFSPMISNVVWYLLVQVFCLVYIVVVKPQLEIKNKIWEIINETVYSFICWTLIFF